SGELTNPSDTTVTEDMSDEPVHVEALGTTDIYSPGVGQIIPLSEVSDQVFAGKMIADGICFIPVKGEIVAPFDVIVNTIFPTKLAIVLDSES
ncbi:PTS glucose transporter subunit IIA, partial [Staphylococcus aureus]